MAGFTTLQQIAAAVIDGDHEAVGALTRKALQEGVPAAEILNCGLIAGMSIVGDRFRENQIFVPEVLACTRAMKAGMAHVEPILSATGIERIGKVVIGTVKGDLHDVGKNLCITMLRGAGFEVIDLGVDTPEDAFVKAVERHEASIVALSALLTTTMPNMARTIEALHRAGLRDRVKVLVGGALVTQGFAGEIGADGYGEDASACAALARSLVGVTV